MPSPHAPTANTSIASQPSFDQTDNVVRPLAFYRPRLEANWTEDQRQKLVNLRNEFTAAMGGWNQDPADPRYRELWIETQPIIDEEFEALFGVEAFNDQQIQAVHEGQ